jgi:hypothetical protein
LLPAWSLCRPVRHGLVAQKGDADLDRQHHRLGGARCLPRAGLKYGFKGRRNALLGSAAFGGIDDVRALASNKGDLLIGRSFRTGKLLRYDGPAHLLTMAPTRSGKGVGTIIPNLLTIDRSVICIDPKCRARNRSGVCSPTARFPAHAICHCAWRRAQISCQCARPHPALLANEASHSRCLPTASTASGRSIRRP